MICGLGGRDVIVGKGGADVLVGGRGGDVLRGGGAADTLTGGAGDDDLDGGPLGDDIDGGDGTNWCTIEPADTADRCVYDRNEGVADAISFSTDILDLATGASSVTVRVHATDDTGVESVAVSAADAQYSPSAHLDLVSGSVRDGMWEGTLTFTQWARNGTYEPVVTVWDRMNRRSPARALGATLEITGGQLDDQLPAVELLTPTPTDVIDAGAGSPVVDISARITDALSGVDYDTVSLIVWAPRVNGALTQGWGGSLRLRSGDRYDGIWGGQVSLPDDAVAGSWNIGIYVADRASGYTGLRAAYWGPDELEYRYWDGPVAMPFPDGRGAVTVLGRDRTDSEVPIVSGLEVTPGEVDTLARRAVVDVSARAVDEGVGVGGVYVQLVSEMENGTDPRFLSVSLDRTAGTRHDGTWTGSIILPQGLPPGRYRARVFTWDRDNNEDWWLASGDPAAAWATHVLDTDPVVTVIDSETAPPRGVTARRG